MVGTRFRICSVKSGLMFFPICERIGSTEALLVYVDDLLYTGSTGFIELFKNKLAKRFKVTHENGLEVFLGIEFERNQGELIMRQTQLLDDTAKEFGQHMCNAVSLPLEQRRLQEGESEELGEQKDG